MVFDVHLPSIFGEVCICKMLLEGMFLASVFGGCLLVNCIWRVCISIMYLEGVYLKNVFGEVCIC